MTIKKGVSRKDKTRLYTQGVRGLGRLPSTLSPAHLAQEPGDPLLNSLTGSTRDLEDFYLLVYAFNCPGIGIGIKP